MTKNIKKGLNQMFFFLFYPEITHLKINEVILSSSYLYFRIYHIMNNFVIFHLIICNILPADN